MKLIVTGTGRSGTGYCAQVMREAGYRFGHESVFSVNGLMQPENLEGDASWMALDALHLYPDVPKVLVYRSPSRVISSFMGIGFFDADADKGHWPYIKRMAEICPDLIDISDPFERACHWYVHANERALTHADLVERLERPRWELWNELLGGGPSLDTAALWTSTATNHRPHQYVCPPLPQVVMDVYETLNRAALEGIRAR